jgi:hypothetical protein
MHPPAATPAGFFQPLEENQAVIVGLKHRLSAIATGHDMIHRPRILESQRPRHAIFPTIPATEPIQFCRDARTGTRETWWMGWVKSMAAVHDFGLRGARLRVEGGGTRLSMRLRHIIQFDGLDYEIAPTSRKPVTVLFHPFRKLWVLEHSPNLTWPPILGHFTF